MTPADDVLRAVGATDEAFTRVEDEIWELAEPRFEERATSALQRKTMERYGFSVAPCAGGMDTAFVASAGSGYPVIAFLGEMDALPHLSQKAQAAIPDPLDPEGCGHACGHNLLGAGCMQAAVAAKSVLEERGLAGTVRYYACPGEETGSGKAFMARAGCFDDVDAAFCWHPQTRNECPQNSLANVHLQVTFTGRSSHAAQHPENGRSALDAAELMNVGIQFLREHVPAGVLMHYAFIDAGGDTPNVVPATTSLLYVVRAPSMRTVRQVLPRIEKIAQGAALMTETEAATRVVSAYAELLAMPILTRLVRNHMAEALPLALTEREIAAAQPFAAMADDEARREHERIARSAGGTDAPIDDFILPAELSERQDATSTDVGDVSWIVPTSYLYVTAATYNTALHTWQMAAQTTGSIAAKARSAAAQIMAASALDLFADPALVQQAARELHDLRGTDGYQPLIPEDVAPGAF